MAKEPTLLDQLRLCPSCHCDSWRVRTVPRLRIGDAFFASRGVASELVQCRRCGLEFVNPRPSPTVLDAFYNEPGYAAHSETDGPAQQAIVHARMAALGALPPAASVLDIGCGNGLMLDALRRVGCECAGVEPSRHGRRVAAGRGLTVYPALGAVPIGRSFDLITLYHVLEHVPDLDGLLAAIKGRLRPGGRACFEVPNLRSARAMMFPILPRRWRVDDDRYRAFPIHLYGFSPGSLRYLLRRNGFSRIVLVTAGVGFGPSLTIPAVPGGADGSTQESVPAGECSCSRPVAPRRSGGWRAVARRIWRLAEKGGWGENLTAVAMSSK